jgi:hypothetical protein
MKEKDKKEGNYKMRCSTLKTGNAFKSVFKLLNPFAGIVVCLASLFLGNVLITHFAANSISC